MELKTVLGHIVRNVAIYPVSLNPGYYPKYNFDNPFYKSNEMCPEMAIRGEIDGVTYWWTRDGKYYNYNRSKEGLLTKKDFVEDPKMRLILE